MTAFREKAYLLLSGGQDSFVCLAWALQRFPEVEAISVLYNQRHSKELEYATKIASHFGIKHTMYDIGDFFSKTSDSSLLNDGSHNIKHQQADNLPASFIPNRNGLLLTIISNHAFRNNEKDIHIIAGVCETDYSGYPDCRNEYIQAKQKELSLGLDCSVTIHTPLMWKTKSQTFQMADEARKLKELIEMTLSCYNGDETLHEWGRGCDDCPACKIRKRGYEEYKKSV